MMVQAAEVMPLLLAACPSFEAAWAAYRAEPSFDEELVYVHLSEFARHLITVWRDRRIVELQRAFEVIERLQVEGDHYVREAATIGLLEDLQNFSEQARLDPEIFRQFLGPESTRWWESLKRFWSGESPRVE